MQEKMQEFARIITPASGSAAEEESLGYFLIKHYPGQEKIKTYEKPSASKLKEKGKAVEASEYSKVIDSIKNIGRSKDERSADGIWGPRTQRGIVNILALSDNLLKFAKDIEFTENSDYDESKKNEFSKQIPDEEDPSRRGDLGERAQKICSILDNLNSFSDALHKHLVLRYRQYASEEEFDPPTPSEEPKEIKFNYFDKGCLDQINPFNVTYPIDNKSFSISLNDLKSFSSLKTAIGKTIKDPKELDEWINKHYQRFIVYARAQIEKSLKESDQILEENDIKEIDKIKEKIDSCNSLVGRIKNEKKRAFLQFKINTYITELGKPSCYRFTNKRADLLHRCENTIKDLAAIVQQQQ